MSIIPRPSRIVNCPLTKKAGGFALLLVKLPGRWSNVLLPHRSELYSLHSLMDAVLTRFPFWESDTGTITLNQGSGFILIIYMVGKCLAEAAVPEGVSILDTPS